MTDAPRSPVIRLFLLVACFASVALADDFKTINGKEYKDATISRVEADGIVIRTKTGISKIYFVELPKDVRERFHYGSATPTGKAVTQRIDGESLADRFAQQVATKLEEHSDRFVQQVQKRLDERARCRRSIERFLALRLGQRSHIGPQCRVYTYAA